VAFLISFGNTGDITLKQMLSFLFITQVINHKSGLWQCFVNIGDKFTKVTFQLYFVNNSDKLPMWPFSNFLRNTGTTLKKYFQLAFENTGNKPQKL
jgi:hypothetical protein